MIAQQRILHVADVSAWRNARGKPTYAPAAYAEEGFIHCCRPEQLRAVLERHFPDSLELTVLVVDVERLSAEMVEEEGLPGVMFPHVHGPIDTTAVVREVPVRSTDGVWDLSGVV
jgi:glutathione S-transferase